TQFSQRDSGLGERQAHDFRGWRACLSSEDKVALLPQGDRSIGNFERLRHRLDYRRQDILRSGSACQLFPELRRHRVWFIALTVEQAIYATLEPGAQRLKEDRDSAGHQQGNDWRSATVEHETSGADGEGIQRDDANTQAAVDERAVDQRVYVEQ